MNGGMISDSEPWFVSALDRTWDVLLPHKVGAKKCEGVRRERDVSMTPPFPRQVSFACGCGRWCFCWWEEDDGG
jgi:hypothetical protein